MFGVGFHEFSYVSPQRRDSSGDFVDSYCKAVYFIMVLHEQEGIKVDIAVILDARFNPPIPLVFLHEWVSEEEPRIESTHVAIRYAVPVFHPLRLHPLPGRFCLVLVDPVGLEPVLFWYHPEFNERGGECLYAFLEVGAEFHLVEENIRVMMPCIEPVFEMSDAPEDAI